MQLEHAVNIENPSVRRILRAAGGCFGQKGYDGASLMEIARAADVSKSLLHYHFESKEHLLLEVLLSLCRGFTERLEGLTEVATGSVEDFSLALDRVLAFIEANLDQMSVMLDLRAIAQRSVGISERMIAFHSEMEMLIVRGIRNVLGEFVDRLRISVERVARMVLVQLEGIIVAMLYAQDEAERELVRETFGDLRDFLTRSIFEEVI